MRSRHARHCLYRRLARHREDSETSRITACQFPGTTSKACLKKRTVGKHIPQNSNPKAAFDQKWGVLSSTRKRNFLTRIKQSKLEIPHQQPATSSLFWKRSIHYQKQKQRYDLLTSTKPRISPPQNRKGNLLS